MADTHTNYIPVLPLKEMAGSEKLLTLHAAVSPTPLVVVTESERLMQHAQSLGCDTIRCTPEDTESGPFPRGTMTALNALLENEAHKDHNFMILDQSSLPVSAKALDKAAQHFASTPDHHVLPVRQSEDNPCQFRSYFNTLSIQPVHLFATDQESRSYPSFLEKAPASDTWSGRDYTSYPAGWHTETTGAKFLFPSNEDTAVIGFTTPSLIKDSIGAASSRDGAPTYPYLIDAHDGSGRKIQFDPGLIKGNQHTAWIVPFTDTELLWEEALEKTFSDPAIPIELQPDHGTDAHGYIVMLLEQAAHEGGFDFDMGLRGDGLFDIKVMWRSGIPLIRTINKQTGEIISGRQSFPDIVEPDKRFALISGKALQGDLSVDSLMTRTQYCLIDHEEDIETDAEQAVLPLIQAQERLKAQPVQSSPKPSGERPARSIEAISYELTELDRVIDILSSAHESEALDDVFKYYFGLALELKYRGLNNALHDIMNQPDKG